MTTRRIMRSLTIKEISAVDRPAQEGARKTIMKRFDKEGTKMAKLSKDDQATVDALVKMYVEDDGAKTFRDLFSRAKFEQNLWPAMDALSGSVRSIMGDKAITADDKEAMIRTSVEDFLATIRQKSPDAITELNKFFATAGNGGDPAGGPAGDPANKKENSMSGEEKKVADLEKSVTDLTTELKTAKAMAELSDAEKDFHKSLGKEDAAAFLAMTKEQRAQKIALAKANDETITVAGRTIRKSVVGEDTFAVMKAQQASIDSNAATLKAATEKAEMAEFTKRAETEFSHVAGTAEEKAKMLKAVAGISDEAVRTSFDKVFKAAEAMAKAGFERIGHANGQVQEGSAEDQLDKKAKEHMKTAKCSYEVAYDAVCKSEPALYDKAIAEKPAAPAN